MAKKDRKNTKSATDMEMVATDEQAAAIVAEATALVPLKVGMVPLSDQDDQLARMGKVRVLEPDEVLPPESSGDRAVAGKPWEKWPSLEEAECGVSDLKVEVNPEAPLGLNLIVPGHEPLPASMPIFNRLGWLGQFPEDFVVKLTPGTAVAVVNERLKAAKGRAVRVVKEGDQWVALSPETRELLPARELAETVYEALTRSYGAAIWEDEVPEEPHYQGGVLTMRFLTPKREVVERQMNKVSGLNLHYRPQDDILQMGFHIRQSYGDPTEVALFVSRVICVNGIVAGREEFAWRGDMKTRARQKAWIVERIEHLGPVFQGMLEGAGRMASTPIGDVLVPEALAQYARRNGIQQRYVRHAQRAWENQVTDEGEDRTEWGLANAFTRAFRDLRTDPLLGGRARVEMMERVGEAVRGDEIVTARLRLKDARRVNAEILEEATA